MQARYHIAELAHQNFANQTNTFGSVADIQAATGRGRVELPPKPISVARQCRARP
jgi:hypothetical protein